MKGKTLDLAWNATTDKSWPCLWLRTNCFSIYKYRHIRNIWRRNEMASRRRHRVDFVVHWANLAADRDCPSRDAIHLTNRLSIGTFLPTDFSISPIDVCHRAIVGHLAMNRHECSTDRIVRIRPFEWDCCCTWHTWESVASGRWAICSTIYRDRHSCHRDCSIGRELTFHTDFPSRLTILHSIVQQWSLHSCRSISPRLSRSTEPEHIDKRRRSNREERRDSTSPKVVFDGLENRPNVCPKYREDDRRWTLGSIRRLKINIQWSSLSSNGVLPLHRRTQ